LVAILEELLPSSLIEQVKKRIWLEIVKEILTQYELIVDSYEQLRERPGDNKEQEKYSDGKKSHHTKTQMIILPDGKDIVDIVAGGTKKRYNYIPRKSQSLWATTKFKGDKAYQGEDLITTPIKKQRNRELRANKIAKIKHFRLNFVEHRIRSVKMFRVVQDRFLKSKEIERKWLWQFWISQVRIGSLILPT